MEIKNNIENLDIEASRLKGTTKLMTGVLELIQELKVGLGEAKKSEAQTISIKTLEKRVSAIESLMDYGMELLLDIDKNVNKETIEMVEISSHIEKEVFPILKELGLLNE